MEYKEFELNKTQKRKVRFYTTVLTLGLYTIMAAGAFGVCKLLTRNSLEQKTKNEIIIDSTKVDSTNYQE